MNKKRIISYSIISFVILSLLIFNVIAQAGAGGTTTTDNTKTLFGVDCTSADRNYWEGVYCIWLGGYLSGDLELGTEFVKWLFLIIVWLVIYSALEGAKFPQSGWIRVTLSIVVSFLATFLVSNEELFTALQSYSALGIAMFMIIPILILGAFSYSVAMHMNAGGLVIQRILWLIYSVYLFFRTLTLWIISRVPECLTSVDDPNCSGLAGGAYSVLVKPFYSDAALIKLQGATANGLLQENTILVLMLIVSVFCFYVMVIKNHKITQWLSDEQIQALSDLDKKQKALARANTQNSAEDIAKAGNPPKNT